MLTPHLARNWSLRHRRAPADRSRQPCQLADAAGDASRRCPAARHGTRTTTHDQRSYWFRFGGAGAARRICKQDHRRDGRRAAAGQQRDGDLVCRDGRATARAARCRHSAINYRLSRGVDSLRNRRWKSTPCAGRLSANNCWRECPDRFARLVEQLRGEVASGTRTLAITGMHRREGRTTLALCLARQLAAANIKLALVDADFANPRLASQLSIGVHRGWESRAVRRAIALGRDDRIAGRSHGQYCRWARRRR